MAGAGGEKYNNLGKLNSKRKQVTGAIGGYSRKRRTNNKRGRHLKLKGPLSVLKFASTTTERSRDLEQNHHAKLIVSNTRKVGKENCVAV